MLCYVTNHLIRPSNQSFAGKSGHHASFEVGPFEYLVSLLFVEEIYDCIFPWPNKNSDGDITLTRPYLNGFFYLGL